MLYYIILFIILLLFIYKNNVKNFVKKYYLFVQEFQNKKNINKKIKKIKKLKKPKKLPKDIITMEIGVNNNSIGKIKILLFSDIVPYTCKKFKLLCNNNNNNSYKNSKFHRIIKDFMIQGGEITGYNEKFDDENFDILHDSPYLLSMANSGINTNGSQFFITTSVCPHLDGKHVVFGKVIEGFDIIDMLNTVDTNKNDMPNNNITILNCYIK
jgi:cyclophilin family peptidyl-prolyl cis-trans isomerase